MTLSRSSLLSSNTDTVNKPAEISLAAQKFGVGKIFKMLLKEVSYAHQSSYLIKNKYRNVFLLPLNNYF